jgi:hypothetical protein
MGQRYTSPSTGVRSLPHIATPVELAGNVIMARLLEWRVRIIRSSNRIDLRLASLIDPSHRFVLAPVVEVPHLRLDEMVCNSRHDIR